MKRLKNRLLFILPFFVISYVSAQYVENSEPINVFLETLKIDKNKKYILQANKGSNIVALEIFNGGEGPDPLREQNVPLDYREGLFVEKYWKEMYNSYVNDTIKKYWKKEDFPKYDFFIEEGTRLIFEEAISQKYINTRVEEVIIISEPMYYMDRKYIMFYFNRASFFGTSRPEVVIMEKEKGKWLVIKRITG
jgi:hypothetical protein